MIGRFCERKGRAPALSGGPLVRFLIAETISPGARELLRTEGLGYFDGGGSLFVPTPGAFVFIDRPAAKNQVRALGSIFHGRKAQVLFALFDRRDASVSVNEIADASLVSPSTTSQTLTDLERRDGMQVRGSGPSKERRLVEAAAMIDAWVRYVATQKWRSPDPLHEIWLRAGPPRRRRRPPAGCSLENGAW